MTSFFLPFVSFPPTVSTHEAAYFSRLPLRDYGWTACAVCAALPPSRRRPPWTRSNTSWGSCPTSRRCRRRSGSPRPTAARGPPQDPAAPPRGTCDSVHSHVAYAMGQRPPRPHVMLEALLRQAHHSSHHKSGKRQRFIKQYQYIKQINNWFEIKKRRNLINKFVMIIAMELKKNEIEIEMKKKWSMLRTFCQALEVSDTGPRVLF